VIVTADLGNYVFYLIRSYLEGQAGADVASDEPEELSALLHAWSTQTIYIIGKEQLKILPKANILRRIILWVFLWMRDSSRTKIQHLNVESDRLVEIGFVKTI
jgi:KUP system potassium uptake protein